MGFVSHYASSEAQIFTQIISKQRLHMRPSCSNGDENNLENQTIPTRLPLKIVFRIN